MLRVLVIACFLFVSVNALASSSPVADSLAFELQAEGEALYQNGKFSKAIDKYLESASIFKQEGNWEQYLRDRIGIVESYFSLGKYIEIAEVIDAVETECATHLDNNNLLNGELYYLLAKIDHRFKNAEKVPGLTSRAIPILKSAPGDNREKIAGCYTVLAMNAAGKNDYDRALEFYDQALKLKIQAFGKGSTTVGSTLNNIGTIYYDTGNKVKATEYYKRSLEIKIKQLGDQHPRVGQTYFNIGSIYLSDGDYDEGISYFEKALIIHQNDEADQNRKLAHVLTSLSLGYRLKKEFDLALKYGNRAIDRYSKAYENPIYSASASQAVGNIYQEMESYEQALPFYQQALNTLSPKPVGSSFLDNPNVDRFYASERLYQVLREKMKTLALWNKEEPELLKLEAGLNTAEALIQTVIFIQQEIQSEGSQIDFLDETRFIFEEALGYCHALSKQTGEPLYNERAIGIYEQSKSVLLRTTLQQERAKIDADVPDNLSHQLSNLKEEINEIAYRLKGASDSTEVHELTASLFDKRQQHQSKVIGIEQRFPKYFQMKNEFNEFDLSAIQNQLKQNREAVFAWFMGEKQIFFFNLTTDRIDFNRLVKESELDTAISSFHAMLNDNLLASEQGNSSQLYAEFRSQSSSIFQSIFPEGLVIPESVVLIPDGALNLIPFELLLTDDVQEVQEVDYGILPYLLKKANVRYAYAPSLLLTAPKGSTSKIEEILAFAPSYTLEDEHLLATRSGFAPLKFAQEEIRSIGKILPVNSLTGVFATEEAFKNKASQYRSLHLAMHAITDDESPSFSGLVFQGSSPNEAEEILYAYEISNLELSSELVVLSACNTGSGKQVAGEGPISLARSFRQAGCPNIVQSLWQADDQTTSILMDAFYSNLKDGKGKAEALRLAKLSYLDQSRKNFPHYWAAFILVGDNETLQLEAQTSFWCILGIGLTFLLILMTVYKIKA
ncbi:MAG: CHAT domain-containing protein [Saprospiraceae bacterium]